MLVCTDVRKIALEHIENIWEKILIKSTAYILNKNARIQMFRVVEVKGQGGAYFSLLTLCVCYLYKIK